MSATDAGLLAAPRVALLARAGQARQHLHAALLSAGAQVVLEEDPNAVELEVLGACRLQAVLVALEPQIEEALARLDPALGEPGLTVIYDEAQLACSREGWDAQRWVRHLSAKLRGHGDVLPPGAEAGLPPPLGFVEAAALINPSTLAPQPGLLAEKPALSGTLSRVDDQGRSAPPRAAFQIDLDRWTPTANRTPLDLALVDDMVAHDLHTSLALTSARAATTGSLPSIAHLTLLDQGEGVMPTPHDPPMPSPRPGGGDTLSLPLASPEPVGQVAGATGISAPGALLLCAGIGGPDAVRRVLTGLPVSLALPVLVHMHLEGGRYDKLVGQMERVSPLPVLLAKAGMTARVGLVYVVPDTVAADAIDGVVRFGEGQTDIPALMGALPPDRTAALLLSGADAGLAEPALMLAARGALVGGQSLPGCYDWAAAQALEYGGGDTASPEALAQRVIDYLGG